ncbi:MAG: cell division protein FtsZ [Flavobacteriales bacterium CG_4_10_14_0_2_um_filter_32_8]|nr:MAG: cell division protein FtsZ [Flavobacteriales bacterium CG_4_10_14_0_2_um_filter_32_8]PJB15180.1 MAG: cell division protein FtsZ [Flavobacteriales bacterium CG_4_9_14_3_um_filter_32_8]
MKFDLPKDQASIIKVFGVGGGGSNAVNHMYNQGITGVDFVICNTDAQALNLSPVPNKIQLGTTLTEGLGAGANPEVGKNAAIEDIENIKAILEKNTKMVFITAGMGGGTGSGAAPIIAEAARDLGILTVGIVTIPFSFEGRRRKQQADEGLAELKKHVDTLLVINNDKLRMMHGNLKMGEAFSKADDILTIAAKGIAEIITVAGYINVDFEDVRTVMKNGGTAIMGSAEAEGENRAMEAVTKALASPLLNDNEIKGANFILLNVTSGDNEITMDEIDEITDYIQNEAGYTAELIWGNGTDLSLGNKVSVTVIATGFGVNNTDNFEFGKKVEKKVFDLNTDVPTTITQLIDDGSVEKKITEVTSHIEEPTLKEQAEEQPTLNFETPTQQVVEEEKVVFNLNEDIEEEDFVAENEDTSWNWNKVNVAETEESDEEDEFVFSEKSPEDTIEEEKIELESNTIVWNLHDDSSEEIKASSSDSTNQLYDKEEEKITPVYTNKIPNEEQLKRSQERINKIKELGMKMKTPSGINDLENEPAYKRRKINLGEIPHSSENQISRFTLSEDKDGIARLNDDNSFLHDNVD